MITVSRIAHWLMSAAISAALSASVSAHSILPAQPRYLQPVYLQYLPNFLAYTSVQGVQVSMQGSAILVTIQSTHCSDLCGLGIGGDVELGKFPAGSYTVIVKENSDPASSLSFTVSAPSSPLNLIDHSALWWAPSEPGWGMGVWHGPTDIVFAAWFVYDASGNPTWYTLQAQSANSVFYTGPIYKTRGPYFGAPFDPAKVIYSIAGTGSLYFYNSTSAMFNYKADGVTASKYIYTQAIE